jgi:starvation-inducible DNA-binding protein
MTFRNVSSPICGDVASASPLEVWIDEAEKRAWYLFEVTRKGDEPGR